MALVHVYGLREGRTRSDSRGVGQIIAAQELYTQGVIAGVVITGGEIYTGKPSVGGIMAAELQKRGVIPPENIVVFGDARSTVDEIASFRKAGELQGWDNLADIANETHIGEIRAELQKEFGTNRAEIPVFTAEAILAKKDSRLSSLMDRARVSQNELAFQKQQRIKMFLRSLPFGREALNLVARVLKNKGAIQGYVQKLLHRK